MKRRDFLKYGSLTGAFLPLSGSLGYIPASASVAPQSEGDKRPSPICVFVKPFDRYSHEEIIRIVSESGYDGIDLTFRNKGHISAEVGAREVPRFVGLARKAGLIVPMAVTDITSAEDPKTEESLKVMADNGITRYRMGVLKYDLSLTLQKNLDSFKRTLTELCHLNAKYGVHGASQNHVGANFSSAVWDVFFVVKDLDPTYIGCQYDIRHAVAEGMRSWPVPLRGVASHVRCTCLKDFTWSRQPDGSFKPVSVPLGTGIVDFKSYFKILKDCGVTGPMSVHFEYPLLSGAQKDLPIFSKLAVFTSVLKKELSTLKGMLT